jgi:hypothetical protein
VNNLAKAVRVRVKQRLMLAHDWHEVGEVILVDEGLARDLEALGQAEILRVDSAPWAMWAERGIVQAEEAR